MGDNAMEEDPLSELNERLASAFRDFNNDAEGNQGAGRLVQSWQPRQTDNGTTYLETKGLPVSICGVGDLLALFRYVCCRCRFAPDISRTDSSGIVGRVFGTCQPELCGDVQKYSYPVYLRLSEAIQCSIRSTLCVPIFLDERRSSPVGVVEVSWHDKDVDFSGALRRLTTCLERVQIYTFSGGIDDLHIGLRSLSLQDGRQPSEDEHERSDQDVFSP